MIQEYKVMAFEPEKITREHVLEAVKEIESGKWEIHPSTRYDVIINNKAYPPKEVMLYALCAMNGMNGDDHWMRGGGEPTNKYLRNLGFEIVDKGQVSTLKNIFEETIEELKELINSDPETKDLFKFEELRKFKDSDKEFYIWIGDNKNIIGNEFAHYEISWGKIKENTEYFTVDLDFEGKEKKYDFDPIFSDLEKSLKPFDWSRKDWLPTKSIRSGEPIKFNDPELITKLKKQLIYLENTLGDKVRNIIKSTQNLEIMNEKIFPLNQILFGPPGTGKTYNTINKAISIANPSFDLTQDRHIIKGEYDILVKAKQIVFTTFHQSMSYEDFIEGIKPDVDVDVDRDENKQVIYEIKDGIFKLLVKEAKKPRTASSDVTENYSFDDAWNDLVSEVERSLEAKNPLILRSQTAILGLKVLEISGRGNLILKPIYSDDAKEYTISNQRTKRLQEKIPNLTKVKNIDKEFRAVIGGSNSTAYWSVLNFLNDKISEKSKVVTQKKELPALPHVLIIDEINRGNVSAIFGELITLIEEDKRIGKPEAITLELPYSKEQFGVPSNVYIIGTMNTADRSVEALDTALRRRFSFEEMPPDYDLKEIQYSIFGYPAKDILKTINSRIEKLLDKDHAIGHSFFIGKNETTLVDSFYKSIIPLLQEYFFGDFGKIGLVLGNGFVKLKEWDKDKNSFAEFDYDNAGDFEERNIFEIIDYRKGNYKINGIEMTFKKAINLLMKDKIE